MGRIADISISPQIVRRLRRGNRRAQGEVFKLLSGPVHSMARRILGDAHAAEEVTQETFIDVFTKIEGLRDSSRFSRWVRSIAVNRCLMLLRAPWHNRRAPERGEQEDPTPAQDRGVDVAHALQTLAPEARMVVWLYCVEGYRHEEIAEIFGKSVSFSKSRLQRALTELSARDGNTMEPQDADHRIEMVQGE